MEADKGKHYIISSKINRDYIILINTVSSNREVPLPFPIMQGTDYLF